MLPRFYAAFYYVSNAPAIHDDTAGACATFCAAAISSGKPLNCPLDCAPQGGLKLTLAALQKYPGNHTLRVLQALAMQKLGKGTEALQVRYRGASRS